MKTRSGNVRKTPREAKTVGIRRFMHSPPVSSFALAWIEYELKGFGGPVWGLGERPVVGKRIRGILASGL